MSDDPSARWGDYFRETQHREPSKLLKEAIAYVSHRGRALDLGAGALVDSRYLLEQGFEVTAVDSSAEAAVYAEGLGERFNLVTIRFDVYDFPVSAFDVVNARYALPFNPSNEHREYAWYSLEEIKKLDIRAGYIHAIAAGLE